jgi:hypothetical protein
MEKAYNVRVSMGDGRPVEDRIIAKDGIAAQDLARIKHPGARAVHIIGIDPSFVPPTPKPKRLPKPELSPEAKLQSKLAKLQVHTTESELATFSMGPSRDEQIAQCISLRKQDVTHRWIAAHLNVPESTVRRWIKQHG